MTKPVRKAIFPVAGLGTRFLPATKSIPKEMLTVVDKPVIQHVFDEARDAGIEHFIFVTGRNKSAIEDHFDKQYELEATLKARGKIKALEKLKSNEAKAGATSFTRQQEPLGLGHAVLCAKEMVGDEPVAVILPDMLVDGEVGCLKQIIDVYEKTGGNIIAVEEVDPSETDQYGVVSIGSEENGIKQINGMIEKPKLGTAPSNLIISGRYILQPEIFPLLEQQGTGAGGEIQLTDSMAKLMESQAFYAAEFDGTVYDTGSKIGYLAANLTYGLKDTEVGEDFKALVKNIAAQE